MEETRSLRPEPLLAALIDHEVEFIVIGGFAVAAHGFVRATKDVDVCPEPSEDNLRRIAAALEALSAEPIGLDEFSGEFDLKPDLEGLKAGGNWTLMTERGRLDVMQSFALDRGEGGYGDLAARAVERTFLGHRVKFCGYEDLVRMKRAAGRPQDGIDVESLKAARGELG